MELGLGFFGSLGGAGARRFGKPVLPGFLGVDHGPENMDRDAIENKLESDSNCDGIFSELPPEQKQEVLDIRLNSLGSENPPSMPSSNQNWP